MVTDSAVVVVGLHGAGKSTFASLLWRTAGGCIVELGDGVRAVAEARSATNLVELARDLLTDDPTVLAARALNVAQNCGHTPAIFVGPRTIREFEYLLDRLPRSVTVGVDTLRETRLKDWNRRHRGFSDSWSQRELQESQWETAKLIDRCDIVVRRNDDMRDKALTVARSLVSLPADK